MTIQAKLIAALAILIALIGSHWYAYRAGDRNGSNAVKVSTQAQAIHDQASVIAKLTAVAKENEAQAKAQAAAAQQENANYEKELAQVRAALSAARSSRVRIDPAQFCAGRTAGPAEATPAGSDGQADAGAAFLYQPFADNLRQLAADADEVTADLRTLKAQAADCFAGKP